MLFRLFVRDETLFIFPLYDDDTRARIWTVSVVNSCGDDGGGRTNPFSDNKLEPAKLEERNNTYDLQFLR